MEACARAMLLLNGFKTCSSFKIHAPNSSMPIEIRTGARLHFGPFSFRPEMGRHFGGIGLMISQPGVHLRARRLHDNDSTRNLPGRAGLLLKTMQAKNPDLRGPVQFEILEEIPSHSGLGSGTQLSLAILDGLMQLHDRSATPKILIQQCGRGDRSAIGLNGYFDGGFLVDAGHHSDAPLGELACRLTFPQEWRILLLLPKDATGLHGSEEVAAFEALKPMPLSLTGQLCRLALTEILPAIQTRQFRLFTQALFEYGQRAGQFFAPSQGGVFSSPVIRHLLHQIPELAGCGMAQSSWGPAVALFAENDVHARELQQVILGRYDESALQTRIVAPLNSGRVCVLNTPE